MDELDWTNEQDLIDQSASRAKEADPPADPPTNDVPLPAALRPQHGASLKMPPLPVSRSADGTRTQLAAAPPTGKITLPPPHRRDRGDSTMSRMAIGAGTPPPIPTRATTTMPPPVPARAKGTVPPPIPTIPIGAKQSVDVDVDDNEPTPLPPPMQLDDEAETLPPRLPLAPQPPQALPLDLFIARPPGDRGLGPKAPEPIVDLFKAPVEDEPSVDVAIDSTEHFDKPRPRVNAAELAGVGAAVLVAVIGIGYMLTSGSKKQAAPQPTPAPAAVVQAPEVAPAPAPIVTPAPVAAPAAIAAAPVAPPEETAPAAAPRQVAVPVTSTPSGAGVMLIDNGKASYLGTTPVDAPVDPTHKYDVVFTMPGYPTKIEHLDPRTMTGLTTQLGVASKAHADVATTVAPGHAEVAAPTPRPHAEPAHVATTHTAPPPPTPTHAAPPAPAHAQTSVHAPAQARVAAAEPNSGTLMISTKPPCSIVLDGKTTKLSTPQRSIPLAAGDHKITLINTQLHVNQTVVVQIAPHKPTKLIRDFLKK